MVFDAGIIHQQLRELHFRVLGKAQRALVLELDFGKSILAGNNAGAFDDGRVQDGALQALAGRAIDLYLSFDRAEANDSDVRVGKRCARKCGDNERQ